jgi:type III restriction enzyme
MKLSFESNLSYQQDAIKSITDLLEGQPMADSIKEHHLTTEGELEFTNSISNHLILSDEQILYNLNQIQIQNDIAVTELLDGFNFSVEMETGTGKTYVYLRTVYELNKRYGFKKFVIVVPSVPIREGVLKNLQITHDHFQTLYDKVPINYQVYDSTRVSNLRGFATNNNIEILVINIDSFAKDENKINKKNDKLNGQIPIQFIQTTNPIVIVDEPQNMETEKRIKAISDLNPMMTLRYSATHKNKYNLTYSLNPVKAYDLGLVKQIEVDSVIEENAFNDAFVVVESITATKSKVTAKLTININSLVGVIKKTIQVKSGDDLYALSNQREIYADGFQVESIDASDNSISFTNGTTLYKGESQGGMNDEIMKFQIRKTIEEHLKKEKKLLKQGIKVLSLIFIDRVANYRSYNDVGDVIKGKFALWFEEIYQEFIAKSAYKELDKFELKDIHNGYFSQDSKGKMKDTNGESKADDDTYSLIMRDKEKLLSIDNPLRFIFSHSALREGWDNPNVFQICTLNETKSEIKKRQEIGRGLRLAVGQSGNRTYDSAINKLTVIANESYDDFAKALQKEIENDCGVEFKNRIKNARNTKEVKYKKGFEADPKFLEIWERIKHKTTYRVNYNTDELITLSAKAIKDLPKINPPTIRSTKSGIKMSEDGVSTTFVSDSTGKYQPKFWKIPDIIGYIQSKTELTRTTIQSIIDKSERTNDILINPQLFLDYTSVAIKKVLNDIMIDGIKYQKIGNSEYEMTLFNDENLIAYLDTFHFKVSDNNKTIYDEYIPLDSNVESQFAKDCETSEQIKYYFKLPFWFKIPTPIGTYNPDWAVVFEDDTKIYFVAETKDTGSDYVDISKLSKDEQIKIKCGIAHFKEFDNVDYKVVKKVSQLTD